MRLVPVVVALLVAGCVQSPSTVDSAPAPAAALPPASALDPIGVYDFTTAVDGEVVTGTMHITGSAGAYSGRIASSSGPDIPITSVTVSGNQITVTGITGEGDTLTSTWTLEGNVVTGRWTLGDQSGEARGMKRPN